MSEKSRHITSSDGRHRVAYEMALNMWMKSHDGHTPNLEDQDAFLQLVEKCTAALAHRDG